MVEKHKGKRGAGGAAGPTVGLGSDEHLGLLHLYLLDEGPYLEVDRALMDTSIGLHAQARGQGS